MYFSGILAVCFFWCVGVYNRITRLRARSLEAFAVVAVSLHRYRAMVLEHTHSSRVVEISAEFQQLLRQLEQLDQLTKDVQNCLWNTAALTALNIVGVEVSAHWSVLRTAPADLAGAALPANLMQDWDTNARALQHAIGGFNQILEDYNEAIAQFPATVVTSFLGFEPADQILNFHET